MKNELSIAKENVKVLEKIQGYTLKDIGKMSFGDERAIKERCETHKATCQRWLEFLEEVSIPINFDKSISIKDKSPRVQQKITDLKQAIKEYENNGI